jgi:UDP-GlcNAc:undecaprenyl-phosphate/decaprenyl-phosphate GlcNAc-1-phosphate transferase
MFNFYLTPIIISISKVKRLFDRPDDRKQHGSAVPTMGGIGLFISISVVSLTLINTCGINGANEVAGMTALPAIIAGVTILFFIGMKDDLINLRARKKLIAEIAAVMVLIVIGNLRLSSLQGMFHIGDLRYSVSIGFSLFVGVVIINAFNLIDGIDGLAAAITIMASAIFGLFFGLSGDWEYAVLCAAIIGSLIPFFLYNVFGRTNKIFMGDTGSLILGFLMTVLVFRFNELNVSRILYPHFVAAPAFSFAVLILPMFDTIRVMSIRLYRGKGIFTPDRRHIHHLMLDLGFSHLQSTGLLVAFSLLVTAVAYLFNYLGNSNLVYIILLIAFVFTSAMYFLWRRKNIRKASLKNTDPLR